MNISARQLSVIDQMDALAPKRDRWVKRNLYYYKDLANFLKYNIPEGSSILEIGSGSGALLSALKPKRGVGIDISKEMVRIAKKNFKELDFFVMDGQSIFLNEEFDFVIISDTIGYFDDVELALKEIRKVCHPRTRVIITYQNFLWLPLLDLAEFLRLKMPSRRLNWLNLADIENLLALENYDTIKTGRRLLLPRYIPVVSWFMNKYLARLPLIGHLCLTNYIIARPIFNNSYNNKSFSVSVVIPTRNERGNIENAVRRVPKMGKETEIIFVEGNSTDGTLDEIRRVCKGHPKENLHYLVQDGKGKGDAVRKGFAAAKGDILMILDADLTVPPEDLPKFYNAIATGKGEFINGSRLVYPMEKEAMRFLNIIGNRFFSIAFTWLLGQRIKDTLCGTKVIFKKDYDQLVANRHYFGEFDPFGDFDLLFGSAKMNLKLIEVPIRYDARQYGSTNISRFKHGWILLKMVAFALNKVKFY